MYVSTPKSVSDQASTPSNAAEGEHRIEWNQALDSTSPIESYQLAGCYKIRTVLRIEQVSHYVHQRNPNIIVVSCNSDTLLNLTSDGHRSVVPARQATAISSLPTFVSSPLHMHKITFTPQGHTLFAILVSKANYRFPPCADGSPLSS